MREFAKDFICAVFLIALVGVIFFYITALGGVGMEEFAPWP
jgi:hypothetical protein